MPTRVSSFWKEALLLVATLAIGGGAIELGLRWLSFDPTKDYIRTPGWSMLVRTNDLLPNVSGDYTLQINRVGLRGAEIDANASPKIAVLGGSTVEDWVMKDSDTWVQQLNANLIDCVPAAQSANLGKGGVNARHHLIQLPEILPYLPRFEKFVVLLGLNDFLFDLRIHHPIELPPNWWRNQALMYLKGDEGNSAIVAASVRAYKTLTRDRAHVPASDFGNYQDSLRKAYARVQPDQWVDVLPDLTPHLAVYKETIRSLKRIADAQRAEIVFLTQPFVWSADMPQAARDQIFAGFIGGDLNSRETKWYTPAALEKGLDTYNRTLLEVCRSDSLDCFDLAAGLGRAPVNFFDDFHFSQPGAAAVGRLVAGHLKSRMPTCRK